jgi:gliding motility-associated-like protein
MLTSGLTAQNRVIYIEKGSKQFKVSSRNSSSYQWYVNGNLITGNSTDTYSQQWNAGSDYWLSVAGLTSEGCVGDTFSVLIKVKDVITIGGPQISWVQTSPYVICYDSTTLDIKNDLLKFDLQFSNNPFTGNIFQVDYSLDDTIHKSIFVWNNDTAIGVPAAKVAEGSHTLKIEKLKFSNTSSSSIVDYSSGKQPDLSFHLSKIPTIDSILFLNRKNDKQTICVNSSNVPYIAIGDNGLKYLWKLGQGPLKGGKISSDTTLERVYVDWGSTPGNYNLAVTGNIDGCETTKSIRVNLVNLPVVSLGQDDFICEGEEKVFDLSEENYDSVRWQPGIKGPIHSVNKSDTVRVKVYANGCSAEDEAIITKLPKPVLNLGADTMEFGENLEIVLDANITGVNYNWTLTNRETEEITTAHGKTVNVLRGDWMVVLNVSEDICSSSDTVFLNRATVKWYDKNIPNFITPNKDGHNDVWRIPGISEFPKCTIEIYDRWGRIVFKADHGYRNNWDGKVGDTDLPVDSYYYIINLNDKSNKKIYGTVAIIR